MPAEVETQSAPRRSKSFWSLPSGRRLVAFLMALAIALAVSSELRKWNFFAPGGVLAEPRPAPAFPDVAAHEADGFWDGIEPLTEAELRGSVWIYYVWTFG